LKEKSGLRIKQINCTEWKEYRYLALTRTRQEDPLADAPRRHYITQERGAQCVAYGASEHGAPASQRVSISREMRYLMGHQILLARLYPLMRHSTGSRLSDSARNKGFPPCLLSQVTCKNGYGSTHATAPQRWHRQRWAGVYDTIPPARLAAHAPARTVQPTA
jgi:hypothetical protein